MLKAKVVMPDGVVMAQKQGSRKGSLSPLLSNVVLDELDQELAQRGHRFVRYADDATSTSVGARGAASDGERGEFIEGRSASA